MRPIYLLVAIVALILPLSVHAEHARIELKVIPHDPVTGAEGEAVTASADTDPPQGGLNKRPVAKVTAGQPLVLQFFLTNTYPHGVKKNVTVRYFVVREEKIGQKEVPSFKDGAVTDGKFKMPFKPACRVGAQVQFHIDKPGIYLLRVETQNTDSDHEHFSAIDIHVEK